METETYEYGAVWGRLLTETALVAFIKKDGHARLMLCTRNISTVKVMWKDRTLKGLLDNFDKRYSIHNGNIAVVDLALGDCRSFNIDRVVAINWLGELENLNDIEEAIDKYDKLEKKMEADLGYSVLGGEVNSPKAERDGYAGSIVSF